MRIAELLVAGETRSARYYDAVEEAGPGDVEAVLLLLDAESPEVRAEAVGTLPLLLHREPPQAGMVDRVVRLTTDPDRSVRDWACFVLAEQWREIDTPALRNALAARLEDIDRDARSEALVGLAYRRDPRALPVVQDALGRPSGNAWTLELVAAAALSDPVLHDLVMRHQTGWPDAGAKAKADAARRLTSPDGPGNDVLGGVAEMCRRRSRGEPDGGSLHWWQVFDSLLDIAPHRAEEFFDAVRRRLVGDAGSLAELRALSELAQ